MNTELRNLLDKIYELEGLVHLALKRNDSIEDFLRLITKKGSEVNEICTKISNEDQKSQPQSFEETELYDLQEYTIDEELGHLEISQEEEKKTEPIYIHDEENIHQKGKLVFSINERFRFKSELFENSDAHFNNTLALVASMENFEEAEDFFLNEEGFDPSNPIVKEFMDIIKRYFK